MSDCIALLGGSFDPIHNGHVALGRYFFELLQPAELRVVPAGNPWQKQGLQASADARIEMVRRAFAEHKLPVHIDLQEIERGSPGYTIDTLRSLRAACGPDTSIALLIGADQLMQLESWRDWRQLFDYAHICAASRPGFTADHAHMPAGLANEWSRRHGSAQQIRTTPHGLTYSANDLAIDISATEIRAALQRGERPDSLIPDTVLDYIQQHHLYHK